MQQQRALVNALKREVKRQKGKEVVDSGRISDEQRIIETFSAMPLDEEETRDMVQIAQEELNRKREELAGLKAELDSRFPTTPCAVFKAIRRHKRNKPKIRYI